MKPNANSDIDLMARALDLARYQNGRTGKNPAVGCVVLNAAGVILSEAATGDGGQIHAEELALCRLAPGTAKGGTAYVTLEPCNTRSAGGRSCSERLVDAGLARIVIATKDPHPNGAGGAERLRQSGAAIEFGLLNAEADALYADFFESVTKA